MIPLRDSIRKPGTPTITILLLAVIFYAFGLELTASDLESFFARYALIPSLIRFDDLATLSPFVTHIFLHGGILHLLSNAWFLWIFGDNVELEVGRLPYLALFLLSGIGGGAAQYLVFPSADVPMVGASGAIAGVMGAYLLLFPAHRIVTLVPVSFFLTTMNLPAYVMIGYWFALQVLSGLTSFSSGLLGGVGWWAHVGGFLTGVILAAIFRLKIRSDAS